jgi:hypothetical protein
MAIRTSRQVEYTTNFHNDDRETYVEVGGKIFELIQVSPSLNEFMASWPKDKPNPKVRLLQPIPVRSKPEQQKQNEDADFISRLASKSNGGDKITSTKKAITLGADIPKEISRLLELKEKTTDEGELRKIRKQLRKLDYKRYINKEEK